jgi:photosystem II stability/assembly factor-like uncharacterized protein
MPSSLVRLAATTTPEKAWTAVGPEGVYINALAIDPQRPTTIFAGTRDHGVYKTTDGGRTWNAANTGLNSVLIRTIVIDPTTPTTIYVGVSTSHRMGGFFRSRDGGKSWHEVDIGSETLGGIEAVAIDPKTPSVIHAGSSRGVFKSTDNGGTWRLVGDRRGVSGLMMDPKNPATLYAVSRFGVFKTEDAGGSWRAVNSGLVPPDAYDINTLTIDPRTPTILFAATDGRGVFKSTDGGLSWRGVNAGLTDLRINVLAIDPQTPTTLYAGSWHGVFESRDAGGSWRAINGGLMDLSILALAINPVTPTTLYAGTWGSGVFARDSVSGIQIPQRPKVAGSRAHPRSVTYLSLEKDGTVWLAIEVRGDLPAYAGSRRTIVFKKSSAKRRWEKILEVSGHGTLRRLWHFGSGSVLALFHGWEADSLIMRTRDGGVRWRSSGNLPKGEGVEGMSFVNMAEGWMLISLGAGMSKSYPALHHTLDGGDHWKEIVRVDPTSPGPPDTSGLGVEHKTGIEFHDTDNGWIGALSIVGMGYLYMSCDGGLTWKQQFLAPPKGMPDVNGSVLPPKFFGARTSVAVALLDGIAPHVYVTTDGGRSWGNPRQLPIKRSPDESGVWDFVSATTWAAASNRTLWLSSNGGRTWLQRAIPLPPTHKVDRLVLAGPKTVWLIGSTVPPGGQSAIADYVLGTSDAGLHWTRVTLPEIP